ncbi:hypothetical protein A0H81_11172 [Grifola frondosa]|uniref:Aquaporin-3 n=1 Tax=Grifola frondosa TaxID=5627 RepID=A0A1C7LVA1_GRIFR|nr:hypothetical protein A0H81_11172 [Grifola frondosa]
MKEKERSRGPVEHEDEREFDYCPLAACSMRQVVWPNASQTELRPNLFESPYLRRCPPSFCSHRTEQPTMAPSIASVRYSKDTTGHIEKADLTSVSLVTDVHYTRYPNRWSRIREQLREPAAEFFGTMVLIIFGNGVDCQVVLSSHPSVAASPFGSYLSLSFGWAVGTALGVWISAGISGGHINPAVTIAFATFRDFPWRKVPIYVFAQLMGALCGAGIVYANYIHAIDLVEGGRAIRTVPGTAGLFSTYALPYMTSVSCFFDEFVGRPCSCS